ncbi:MAG TPA: ABATE domain-containing protein [Xanthomonadales bacterium]|nr:ABATE domain-containing protein [Xanthomonadales bacterium]
MADEVRSLESLELVGGSPCLDFVNTVNSRHWMEHDFLSSYQGLIGWAGKAGILRSDAARQLTTHANLSISEADAAFRKALTLRDLLYQIFSLLARRVEPDAPALARFNALYAEAISAGKLARTEHGYAPAWDFTHSCEAILYPVLYSAGELLLSPAQRQIKECPGCGWLFLDTSKNHTRRWCNMNTCGVRSKMKRYYVKQRTS